MAKCCYYEKDKEKKTICTSDINCPIIDGWKKQGEWGVNNCKDCLDSAIAIAELDGNVEAVAVEGSESVTVG
jgi:hypothetical protein